MTSYHPDFHRLVKQDARRKGRRAPPPPPPPPVVGEGRAHRPAAARRPRRTPLWFWIALVALPMGAGTAVFLAGGPPPAGALAMDKESGRFAKCGTMLANPQTCVIDGDTIRYHGEKIRVADINTPETFQAQCAEEKALGDRATARMVELMNDGPFSLKPVDRSHDQYGRALFTVTRGGDSVGAVLVEEGLAEQWKGYRSGWC